MKIFQSTNRIRNSAVANSVMKFVLFSLFVLVSSEVSAAIIQFQGTAQVQGSVVYLRDIAKVVAETNQERQFLQNIMIAPTPAPGKELRLTFDMIRSRISATGTDLSKLEFGGRTVIKVSSQQDMGQRIKKRVTQSDPSQVKRAERVLSEAIEKDIRLKYPKARFFSVEVQVSPHNAGEILKGSHSVYQIGQCNIDSNEVQRVAISFLGRTSEIHQFQVQCRISDHPDVVVAKYDIPRGQILRKADFTYRQIEKYDPEDMNSLYTQIEDVAGSEASRSIRKGTVVGRKDIREIPLVRANDVVDVVARRGSISITTRMKAKQDGVKGEFITLKSFEGKTFVAKVVGLRSTEIDNGSKSFQKRAGFSKSARNQRINITASSSDYQYNSRMNRGRSVRSGINRQNSQPIVPVNGRYSRKNNRVRTGNYSFQGQ